MPAAPTHPTPPGAAGLQRLLPPMLRRRELVAVLLLLTVVIACAIAANKVSQLSTRRAAQQMQWMQVQSLAAQATALHASLAAQPPTSAPNTSALLHTIVTRQAWGSGQGHITMQGDTATLTVHNAPAATLATTLEQLRQQARIHYTAARWTVDNGHISGTATLQLPPTQP